MFKKTQKRAFSGFDILNNPTKMVGLFFKMVEFENYCRVTEGVKMG
jgi:hypothetical protein